MGASKRIIGAWGAVLVVVLSGCATASNPWEGYGARAARKAALMDPGAICPVVVENGTNAALDASYEVVGMRFDLGILPSGQSAQFKVQCQAGRVRATAVSHAVGLDEPQERFQKMARLDLASVTRVHLTQADQIY
jgi:hypothetical protein